MSEVMSFGNIVNSLLAVRDDYHQHLKTVPQYDAFLLVESSTERVASTLQGTAHSGTPSMAGEVIEALETAKAKFRQHLTGVPEYRALLAIDKLISDISVDLGVQPVGQAIPQADTEQAAMSAMPATGAADTTIAAEPSVVAEPAAAETATPIAQETTIMQETMVDEPIQASAEAQPLPEVSSADAISQVQMALRSAEDMSEGLSEAAPVAEADHGTGALAEPAAPTVSAEPSPSEAVGQETEKAA
jgi:hypothetical protein